MMMDLARIYFSASRVGSSQKVYGNYHYDVDKKKHYITPKRSTMYEVNPQTLKAIFDLKEFDIEELQSGANMVHSLRGFKPNSKLRTPEANKKIQQESREMNEIKRKRRSGFYEFFKGMMPNT